MAIFRYTLFKYIKAPSTWVILLISMFIAGFLGGYLPMSALNFNKGDTIAQNYAILVIAVGGGVTAFLSIFMSVFAGFKGASMFRDEVEDGTFLVMLSKPQTRAKIIFQKWLALQSIMLAYSFLSILTFVVCVEIFDKGDTIPSLAAIGIGTLKSSIFRIGGYIWAILIVVGLIFSSIAILLSTRLSAGATVGISISLGIIIPITGMVSMFTSRQDYVHIKNPTFQRMGLLLDTTAKSSEDEIAKIVAMTTSQQLGSGVDPKVVQAAVDNIKTELKSFFQIVDKSYKLIDNTNAIYNVALKTGETDTFKDIWGFDFNYQLRQMSSVVTNSMVPQSLKPQLQTLSSAKLSGMHLASKVTGKPDTSPDVTTWLDKQIETDIRTQIFWGLTAKKLITDIADLFTIHDEHGNVVPTETLVKDLLLPSGIPATYDVPKQVREYLDQSLVKTTLTMVYYAIYAPIISIINPTALLEAAPADWKTNAKNKGFEVHYINMYDQIYNIATGKHIMKVNGVEPDPNFKEEVAKDATVYALLRSVAEDPNNGFVFMETTDYVPGMTLLYIYLGIALGLLPLSYFIVRREDFR